MTIRLLVLSLTVASIALASEPIKVGYGRNILSNGKFGENEWSDAVKTPVDHLVNLYAKQDDKYLYLGIEFVDTMHTGIDLYLAESSFSQKMLHVSSAIAQSEFHNGKWPDPTWGGNQLWTANVVGMVVREGERGILPLDGFEFQIDKSLFHSKRWCAIVHLKRPDFIYPTDADIKKLDTWQIIEL